MLRLKMQDGHFEQPSERAPVVLLTKHGCNQAVYAKFTENSQQLVFASGVCIPAWTYVPRLQEQQPSVHNSHHTIVGP